MQILLLQASGLSVVGSPAFILTVVGLQGKVEFKINFTEGNKAEFVTTGTIHTLTILNSHNMEENTLYCSMTIATDVVFTQSIPQPIRREMPTNHDEVDSGLPEILARAIAIATSSRRQLSWKVKENPEATLIKMEWRNEAIPIMNPNRDNVDSK